MDNNDLPETLPEQLDLSVVATDDMVAELIRRYEDAGLVIVYQARDADRFDGDRVRYTGRFSTVLGLCEVAKKLIELDLKLTP